MTQTQAPPEVGGLLRDWRQRRRVSQLDLATRAGVSTRHLSYVETGRSRPTSQMILRLSDQLGVPLREQNRMLLAGGFAPAHPEHALDAPPMAAVHDALEGILQGHLPFPALVVDGGWEIVAANEAIYALCDGVDPSLLEPPVNAVRLTLDAGGLAPRITNLPVWRDHLMRRIAREHEAAGDDRLRALLEEYGAPAAGAQTDALVVPLVLRTAAGELSFISTTTVFGTPREVTLSELAIESFFPADEQTRRVLTGG